MKLYSAIIVSKFNNKTQKSETRELGRFVLEKGKITIEGDVDELIYLVETGVEAPEKGKGGKHKTYYMKDGRKFLEALKYQYCGAYCYATEVIQEK